MVASWSTGGGTTRVQLLRDGGVIWDNAPQNSSIQDCPPNAGPATVKYTLKAYNNAGQQDKRDVQVQIDPAPPKNPLANTNWLLQSTEATGVVPQGVSVTAYFGADGSLTGNGGCNAYTSSDTVNNQNIAIQIPTYTGALCGEPADSIERTYLQLLPTAAKYEISGNQLIVRANGNREILRYTRIEISPMVTQ